ncbi:unnamed protein product [Moneuplotes crassus]|uniref:PPM-type phosphatase domain-containing protein n=1 Tax=Euplotes crassus TaxID=5936 RepID=A0AAD1U351_EUPCR|nr:unnamed protein product [Moneuplotes crassus]
MPVLKRHKQLKKSVDYQSSSLDSRNKTPILNTETSGKIHLSSKKNSLNKAKKAKISRNNRHLRNLSNQIKTNKDSKFLPYSSSSNQIPNIPKSKSRKYSFGKGEASRYLNLNRRSVQINNGGSLETISNNKNVDRIPLLNPMSEKSRSKIKNKLRPFFRRNRHETITLDMKNKPLGVKAKTPASNRRLFEQKDAKKFLKNLKNRSRQLHKGSLIHMENQQSQAKSISALSVSKTLTRNTFNPEAQASNLKYKPRAKSDCRYSIPQKVVPLQNQVAKYSYATKKGISMKKNIPPKSSENQDSYIASARLFDCNYMHFFAVCDGHGANGDKASGFLKNKLPEELKKELKSDPIPKNEAMKGQDLTQLTEQGKYPQSQDVYNAIVNSFLESNGQLINQEFDTKFSGSTCCSLLIIGKRIYCGNVGDSRCILIRIPNLKDQATHKEQNPYSNSNSMEESGEEVKELQITVLELSRDHKPENKDEKERIESNGGEIQPYLNDKGKQVGPMRVWVKSQNFPGLAMSRSFGDQVASYVGVSVYPEIKETTLTPDDAYVIIASDGVWEFMENREVAEIVYEYYAQGNAERAAEEIVREAFNRWKKNEVIIDDITCIILFLDVKN